MRASLLPQRRMTDWLSVCRGARDAVARTLDELPTRIEREPPVGIGMGGDETTAIDAAAEAAVVSVLETAGLDFTLVSEELGEKRFGSESPLRVVLDPIDGSLNAKRGLPFFAVSIAVADGPAMDDVFFAYVHDYGSGEEWTAARGAGARLDGRPLRGPGPKDAIEVLAMEATRTDLVADSAAGMIGFAYRTRVFGSLAVSLCHLAAGRVDAVCSLKPARSVDIAAAQLIVRERGLAIDLPEDLPFERAPLDVDGRSRVVAAATPERCAELFARLSAVGQAGAGATRVPRPSRRR
jgi:myo-inositol-1(or 4)-monophosphatase